MQSTQSVVVVVVKRQWPNSSETEGRVDHALAVLVVIAVGSILAVATVVVVFVVVSGYRYGVRG